MVKQTVRQFGQNLTSFNKEKEDYLSRAQINQFMLDNKLEAKGNIRKTITYRNVGTMACTMLMANLGLSVFLSNLYMETEKICSSDINQTSFYLAKSGNERKAQLDLIYSWYESKYHQRGYDVVQFVVGDLYYKSDPKLDYLREDEVIKCEGSPDLGNQPIQIIIVLDN